MAVFGQRRVGKVIVCPPHLIALWAGLYRPKFVPDILGIMVVEDNNPLLA